MNLAIRQGYVKTEHTCVARCRLYTYDVLGNARNGFEVNDVFSHGEFDLEAQMYIANVPLYPGAKDQYNGFSSCHSFTTELLVNFEIPDKAIAKSFGVRIGSHEIESDGDSYYLRKKNGKPLGEIRVLSWHTAS